MKKIIFFAAIVSTLFFSKFLYAQAPPLQRWAVSYNGPANGSDYSCDIATDSNGCVYVTGLSDGNNFAPDYATIKYDPNGIQKWAGRYNGTGNDSDGGKAIAVDCEGNVYVTGKSWGGATSFDYATIKYDSGGCELWAERYDGPVGSDDSACAIALDTAGNTCVTGTSLGSGTREDYATIKYDPNGNQQWIVRYDGPANLEDYAYAIAADNSGSVYVTGKSSGGTNDDYATVKYAPDGNELWIERYDGPANSDDFAQAITLDSAGNIYVTGSSWDSNTNYDYATVKYDANGVQKWVGRYNGAGNSEDYAKAIVSDSQGNVYVTGRSYGSSTNYDYATVKYDTNGVQKWVARYNGQENLNDYAHAIALDNTGNIYITGTSDNGTDNDYITIKYDPNGNQEWIVQYNRPENPADDYPAAIAADNLGNIYITGHIYDSAIDSNYITIKYTPCTLTGGDFDDNCKVDFADYAILAQAWSVENDWQDLAILADNWLGCGYGLQEDCW